MAAEIVLDASVAVKCFITEPGSDEARALVAAAERLIAPEFIFAEIASVSVKRAKRGDVDRAFAEEMVEATPELLSEVFPAQPLVQRAQALAFDHGISIYDALYVALAEARGVQMVTADVKLATKLSDTPQGPVVRIL